MPPLHLRVLAPDVPRIQGNLQPLQGFTLSFRFRGPLGLFTKGQVIPLVLARLLSNAGFGLLQNDPRLPPFLARTIYLSEQVPELILGNRRLPRIEQFPFRGIPQDGRLRIKRSPSPQKATKQKYPKPHVNKDAD